MRRVYVVSCCVVICAAVLAVGSAARVVSPPPGATAVCNDGTYSFSQTHSGTCSHHGGVAQWLDGSDSNTSAAGTGTTVLLAPRTRSSTCALRAEPDRRCSPGAYYAGLTTAVICSSSFRTSTIRDVGEAERHDVEAEYGLAPRSYWPALEIDHIVPLELGGSNDVANLFPEQAPGYHSKDSLENRLHALVCAGAMTLRSAQEQIASDWEALYRRVFGVAPRR